MLDKKSMLAANEQIAQIEKDIDTVFADNKLKEIGYAQAVWTLLSVTEDLSLRSLMNGQKAMEAFADGHLNCLTYPLRVCHGELLKEVEIHKDQYVLNTELVDEDYKLAWEWCKDAYKYFSFCCIFPLWHHKSLELVVNENNLIIKGLSDFQKEYEAYNRLIKVSGAKDTYMAFSNSEGLVAAIRYRTTVGKNWFKLNFNPKLVAKLVSTIQQTVARRQDLPENWQFDGFTIAEYRKVFTTLQAMLFGWSIARQVALDTGIQELGYVSSVWVVPQEELHNRLKAYTSIKLDIIKNIVALLTFGFNNIRHPDIAIQPIVDLKNGLYALSPFIWMATNPERNLCVLLNQIPSHKEIYSKIKNEKEDLLKSEVKDFLSTLNLEFSEMTLGTTDIDIAIIDRNEKLCLCLELKWFIEPAEIREVITRAQELRKGVIQAKKIKQQYEEDLEPSIKKKLNISPDYRFMVAVASQNWIGYSDIQDDDVPIIKVWHLMDKIKETGSLLQAIDWLSKREYLPLKGVDYEVPIGEISYGGWCTSWYSIKPLKKNAPPIIA
jgi:hypothetical protein